MLCHALFAECGLLWEENKHYDSYIQLSLLPLEARLRLIGVFSLKLKKSYDIFVHRKFLNLSFSQTFKIHLMMNSTIIAGLMMKLMTSSLPLMFSLRNTENVVLCYHKILSSEFNFFFRENNLYSVDHFLQFSGRIQILSCSIILGSLWSGIGMLSPGFISLYKTTLVFFSVPLLSTQNHLT